ncbi:MAG: rRNA maturation RNase YbeY [Pseudophaeobacter sp. bin_em_oilr2.035]|uniref:Endoribonuclease YbeY n=1 Tax=Phaeobacter gallaeciensis TaxID=60890 RepID=A0ABD4X9C7_9RHOB|nr:rRNA maturation RNase YbeY [Phaeobacter gallaeciensis]MDF1773532.1 rRNA maturation RNase YbeY [Pseudophaeobacter sp. bin_em_oilr2.035]MDE4144855.1 rRNA maturation RNase YbeY [Phaeobacter gallaeciensis]MDE4157525.1 rRNA maturation RNase YbeY [Phaeobacter gallaeciensis]MDE4161706.1 rRNA maturation RNase YbeY [Phaeobacter gallaeciensis]MDE4165929.1 rRNA maturation RNase YbeY [Phaeobacter gallaeciensis]
MTLEIYTEDSRWDAVALEALAERSIGAALAHFDLEAEECEISLLACDDARIADLNAEFREKPTPTNVLSWPAEELSAEEPGGAPLPPETDFTGEIPLGDIAIAYETCAREAEEAGKPLADHLCHLLVHGVLHLLGYDHIRDPDATLMEGLEVEILGKLGIDNPYTVNGSP